MRALPRPVAEGRRAGTRRRRGSACTSWGSPRAPAAPGCAVTLGTNGSPPLRTPPRRNLGVPHRRSARESAEPWRRSGLTPISGDPGVPGTSGASVGVAGLGAGAFFVAVFFAAVFRADFFGVAGFGDAFRALPFVVRRAVAAAVVPGPCDHSSTH